MIKSFFRKTGPAGDSALRDILRQHDPVEPLASAALFELENAILGQINAPKKDAAPTGAWEYARFFQQGWTAQVAAFASVIIVALGFIVGQATSGERTDPLLAGNLSLVAFTDDALGQSVPVTETSWGEDDDAE